MLEDNVRNNTVRISSTQLAGFSDLGLVKTQAEIITALGEMQRHIRVGTADDKIDLVGENGVQNHIRESGAYVFFGKPSLGEVFKLVSLFVGLQTLDPDLHYEKDGELYRRPVVIYGDRSEYQHLLNVLNALHKEGTIRQPVEGEEGLLRFAETPQQLKAQLAREVPIQASIHGGGVDPDKIAERAAKYEIGVHKKEGAVEPEFKVIAYTSASVSQSEEAKAEAYKYGQMLAENDIGLISGLGKTGLMYQVHKGAIESNGWSSGSNCPHIIVQEGLPDGFSRADIIEDIYARMQVMFAPCDFVGASVGGRGGGGSLQEILGAFLLMDLGREEMLGKNGKSKPVAIDNRLGIWDDLQPLMQAFGFSEGKDYHFAKGTEEMIEMVQQHQRGVLPTGDFGGQRYNGGAL